MHSNFLLCFLAYLLYAYWPVEGAHLKYNFKICSFLYKFPLASSISNIFCWWNNDP